jgi:hypothetical protein
MQEHKVGDILFLEREIRNLPYPTGYWVLCRMNEAIAHVAMVTEDDINGVHATDNWYKISVEDLPAFTPTGKTAKVPPPSSEGREQ